MIIAFRYAVMENMRHLLSSYDPKEAHYIGSRRHWKSLTSQGYMEGGSGINLFELIKIYLNYDYV